MVLRLVFCIFVCLNRIVESSSLYEEPPRIVGGEPADITELPYQLALELIDKVQVCGASIIHRSWAITAAHCFSDSTENEYVLRSGSSYKETGGTLHQIEMIIRHPNYGMCTPADYDVAVIKVINPFVYSDVAQKISIATTSPHEGTTAVISGWGLLKQNGTAPQQLQKATISIQNYDECKDGYGILMTPRMLCAYVPGEEIDTCQGDSGGPLVANNTLVGITSWGSGCGAEYSMGIYADVAKMRKWIISTIRSNTEYCKSTYHKAKYL